MIHANLKAERFTLLAAALSAAVFIFGSRIRAADEGLPVYFPDSKLILKPETLNRTTYLPAIDIIEFLSLPYTDALALETLTIRSGNSRLVVTKNSALISINDQIVLLRNPILRENDRWLAPIEFLSQGLSRITNMEFRQRPGTARIFAGGVQAPELVMNAQGLGPVTRLTIRAGAPMNLELRRDDSNNRVILAIDRTPVDPLRERLDHKDRLVRSITFNDSDGAPKIFMDITGEAGEIKITPADDNRLFFVDVSRKIETTTVQPPPPPVDVPAPKTDTPQPERKVRVVVIDAGHGGIDSGTKNAAVAEKDLTLLLARKLRTVLQSRLGATVLLTRDSDIALDNESRSAVANNNQANVFISLHIGYSENKLDSGSSVFVMKEDFGGTFTQTGVSGDGLFLPWYLGYRTSHPASVQAAKLLQEELSKTMPGWKFPLRTAPLGVLSSATMPSLLLEIGNLNNSVNSQTLMDSGFQNRFVNAIADSIQRFSESQQGAAAN